MSRTIHSRRRRRFHRNYDAARELRQRSTDSLAIAVARCPWRPLALTTLIIRRFNCDEKTENSPSRTPSLKLYNFFIKKFHTLNEEVRPGKRQWTWTQIKEKRKFSVSSDKASEHESFELVWLISNSNLNLHGALGNWKCLWNVANLIDLR